MALCRVAAKPSEQRHNVLLEVGYGLRVSIRESMRCGRDGFSERSRAAQREYRNGNNEEVLHGNEPGLRIQFAQNVRHVQGIAF